MILYEIAITRVLSVVLWYHFAFLSVSLALLGLGAPGVWFSRFAPSGRALLVSLLAAGIAVPVSVIAITQLVGPMRIAASPDSAPGFLDASGTEILSAGVVWTVVAMVIPFLALGACICLLLFQADEDDLAKLYGADLLGAALGAALVVPLLNRVPTPLLLASVGFIPLAAAALLFRASARVSAVLALLLLVTIVHGGLYRLHATKKYEEGDRVLHEKWTATGRISVFPDIFHARDPSRAFAWGLGQSCPLRSIDQLWLEQDASAGTPITKWSGSFEDLEHLFCDVTSVGYQITEPKRVCVIGAGGGRDVLTALRAGADSVVAVELNPYIIRTVRERFGVESGDPYGMPGVRAVASEGRSYLTRTRERFDLIQISMVDSWAATAAGAFTLSENHLYTVEALRLDWNRLTPNGILSFSRWYLDRHLLEAARLLLLASDALQREGVSDPRRHFVVVGAQAVATILIFKQPLSASEIESVDRVCMERGFERVWPPHEGTPPTALLPGLLLSGPGPLTARGVDLSPPTDDRPFFFQTVPLAGKVDKEFLEKLSINEQSVLLLRKLVLVVAALAFAMFFLPLVWRPETLSGSGFWSGSMYFAGIGLAFLLVEFSWIHRFILYLGHPSYATTVVLAAVLLGAGFGSWTSSRVSERGAARAILLVPASVLVVCLILDSVFTKTLGAPFAIRVVASLLLLLPGAYFMGFAFPLGMTRFGGSRRAWFWAMNGAFGVLAGVFALALAMIVGFKGVGWAGCAVYAVVALLYFAAPRERARLSERAP